MSAYFRNVFQDLAAAFSPMAPGNMKSEFIGIPRSKLTGKSYSTRKLSLKNSDGSTNEAVSLADNMDHHKRSACVGDTLPNNAGECSPASVVLNITRTDVASEVSNIAQSDNVKSKSKENLVRSTDLAAEMGLQTDGSVDKNSAEVSHLKILSMLHLDVIEQQQRQIQSFEKEAQRLRAENETLKSRLERMNRRTHLAEKSDPQPNNNHRPAGRPQKLDSPLQKRKRKSELDTSLCSSLGKSGRGKEATNLQSSFTSVQSSAGSLELSKRSRHGAAEKLAKKEEKKSAAAGRQDSKESREEEKYHRTDVPYPCLSDLRVPDPDPDFPDDDSVVMVPSWRVNSISPGNASDVSEECDDATFQQRHCKLEQDERKRKRWDIQRIRELREHERLVNKQKQREYAQWEHILTTFYPEDNDAEHIEMCESLPVITFGVQVPAVKPSEFELPWFDAKQRERDEQRRKSRRQTSRR